MSSETTKTFRVTITKAGIEAGTELKDYKKLNHAVRHLWKARNVAEGYVTIVEVTKDGRTASSKLLAKIGRRRGILVPMCLYITAPFMRQRPPMKKAGDGWHRLPNRFNDIL